jgi:hypothetical protein
MASEFEANGISIVQAADVQSRIWPLNVARSMALVPSRVKN